MRRPPKPAILVSGGNHTLCQDLKKRLHHSGLRAVGVSDPQSAPRRCWDESPQLVIVVSSRDTQWCDSRAAELVRRWCGRARVILLTRRSSETRVLAALKAGVQDYLRLPVSDDELTASVRRILENRQSRRLPGGGEAVGEPASAHPMVGESPAMREVKTYLDRVAATDSTLLITGETGTGKELAAEQAHRQSPRRGEAFICVNCAALPETLLESELFGYERGAFTGAVAPRHGKFELAEGGTVFLDEIGDMPPYAQAKILRVIEKKEVYRLGGRHGIPLNIRVIAATNQDPEELVGEGKFRSDLYYRLNVARVHLPPLRERKEDIIRLVDFFLRELNQRFGCHVDGLSQDALDALLYYDWPGNVRELKNLLEAAFIHLPSRRISLVDLPPTFQSRLQAAGSHARSERDQLLSALFATNWNKSKTAQKLRWSRMKVYRKIQQYSIGSEPPSRLPGPRRSSPTL